MPIGACIYRGALTSIFLLAYAGAPLQRAGGLVLVLALILLGVYLVRGRSPANEEELGDDDIAVVESGLEPPEPYRTVRRASPPE